MENTNQNNNINSNSKNICEIEKAKIKVHSFIFKILNVNQPVRTRKTAQFVHRFRFAE